jgi:hypothetical protein
MPFTDTVRDLYLSDDKAFIYVTTYNSNTRTFAIKRIGLNGQQVPGYIYQLQDILPQNDNSYSLSLVNFSLPPTVLVQPYADASAGNFVAQAQSNLQSLGFDIGQLRFQQGPPATN